MAELPRYGTQTPRVNAPDIGVHRMRGLEDATYAALQGSRTAADMSEYFMRQVERANIQEAEQAGAVVARDDQGNIKPIALRDSSSPSAVAFNNAQRQAWTSAAATEAAAQFKTYAHRSLNPVDDQGRPTSLVADPIQSFDKQASGYIAAAFKDKNMPDDVRSALVTRMGQVAAEHRTWLVDQVHHRNLAQTTSQLEADQNRIIGEAVAHARTGNAAAVTRSRADFVAAVQGIADINPAFGKDKQEGILKTFDAAVYFSDVERKALAAFGGAASFRESGMGRAAGLRVVDSVMTDAIAKFGPSLANEWSNRINAKIQLEASVRESVDAITMRRAEEAYLASSIRLSQPVIAALKGNGENPITILQQQSDLLYQQFKGNPQLARMFQNRFIQTFNERSMEWSPDVVGANQAQNEWFSSIKAAVARGDIAPQSVVPMMLNEFEKGSLPSDPKFDSAVRNYASAAEVQQIGREDAAERASTKAFETDANANARRILTAIRREDEETAKHQARVNTVRDAMEGRGNPLSVNSDAAKALDEVWAKWDFKVETHAPMMTEMMLRGGGLSAKVKEDLRGLITSPTEGMVRKYMPLLGLMLTEPNIRATLLDQTFHTSEDRARLGRLWSEIQQHGVNMQSAGSDQARQDIERKRFSSLITDVGRNWADSAISGPAVRARIPNFDGQVAAAGIKTTDELSSIGVDALDGWFGLSTTPGRAVFGGYEGSTKPFQAGYNVSAASGFVQKAVEGLSFIMGGNPFSGYDVAAGLPIIGWAFEKHPVTINPVDKQRMISDISSRALEMGGDIDGAAANAKRAWDASGYRPSFYSGANNAVALKPDAKYTAEWTHKPIDGGPGGPMVARAVLKPLADKFIAAGFKFADSSVSDGIQAVSKPGLWNVKFDSDGSIQQNGKTVYGSSYEVRVLADTGPGEKTLVPIGKVFVPTISATQLNDIRSTAEQEAHRLVTQRVREHNQSVAEGNADLQRKRELLAGVKDGTPLTQEQLQAFRELQRSKAAGQRPIPEATMNHAEVKMLAKWIEYGLVIDLARSGTASSPIGAPVRERTAPPPASTLPMPAPLVVPGEGR